MDAYENRIPVHYIKGHTFWVGQEGCGYVQSKGGMREMETNVPLYRIPIGRIYPLQLICNERLGGLYQSDVAFGEGVSWRDFPRTDCDATGVPAIRFSLA